MTSPDVVVIGSGMGGATLAAGLAPTGARIVILERGRQIPDDAPVRDPNRIFRNSAFRSDETWLDARGRRFAPGNYYQVGGNSKLYGAVLIRYRAEDFAEMQHEGGVSPAWPFPYETLAPYYDAAERLYAVRGDATGDPTEPPHGPYPHPPVPDEPAIAAVRARLARTGVRPFSLPLGVDIDRWLAHGRTGWDGYPDTRSGKMDAETCGLAAALAHPNVSLVTEARVSGLTTGQGGRVTEVVYRHDGAERRLTPGVVALAAGAVQSAALLLASGVANRSDQVGRCFMNHNATGFIAVDPGFNNDSTYQKTFGLNDWYLSDGAGGPPLGNMQLLGRVVPDILQAQIPLAAHAARPLDLAPRDRPLRDLRGSARPREPRRPQRLRHPADLAPLQHDRPSAARRQGQGNLPRRGLSPRPFAPVRRPRALAPVRHRPDGADPAASPIDPDCRAWDHPNLYVADAAALPTSAAVNPALTVAAMALRASGAIGRDLGA